MNRDFRRVAIINRGEAAMRLIHAVREFNREHDLDLETIAIYTEPERRAMFVREADHAVLLGPASFVDAADGQRKNAYLNYAGLERALVKSRAEAVWLGWGFVAEHPDFADQCARMGLVFIGPDGDCMRKLGDKITSKRIAEQAGVPIAPWSGGPVGSLEEARLHAEQIGFPLMIKATAGGGGRGIRACHSMADLGDAYERASSEALKGFGNATVFMERLLEGARHIEVQVIADHHGNVWSVGVRDCSVQRRNQKLIEESSSPVLTDQQQQEIKDAAARLCREAGYHSAGTVEFLYDPKHQQFAFMEVNARLQVEHPVTEVTTGLDLVKLQLHVARDGRLEGTPPARHGCAIEVRLNAEDPDNNFAPAPGDIELLRLPTGAGIRIDTGVEQGDRIPSEFDSMIAKVIAHGSDRNEALARLRRALSELSVVIRGGTTNRAFLLDLLTMLPVVSGSADVGWLDREPPSEWDRSRPHAELALMVAAIELYEEGFAGERREFLASALRGRPKLSAEVGKSVELSYAGNLYRIRVYRFGDRNYRLEIDGHIVQVDAEALSDFERRIVCNGQTHRILSIADGVNYLIEVDGTPHRVSRDDAGIVRAPAPAVVVALNVKAGTEVSRGDTLAILEAMKLEMRVVAPYSGTVRKIEVETNEQVPAGGPLLRIKPSEDAADETSAERLSFEAMALPDQTEMSARQRCRKAHVELQNLMLGFDIDPGTISRVISGRDELCRKLPPTDEELMRCEDIVLNRFVDLCDLSQRQPEPQERALLIMRRSPQESMFAYLRALDTHGVGLSQDFLEKFRRALAHYGIEGLEHTSELEEALLWIHKSHSRLDHQISAIISILERRLRFVDELRPSATDAFRAMLDRLAAVSQDVFPALEDLARELRYEYFDKPLYEQSQHADYRNAGKLLAGISGDSDASDRAATMQALVNCPQPLMTVLSEWAAAADLPMRQFALECLTRRYYRIRELENLRVVTMGDYPLVTGEYEHDGRRIHLVTTYAQYDQFARSAGQMLPLLAKFPDDHDIVIDFYLHRVSLQGEPVEPGDHNELEVLAELQEVIEGVGFPRSIRRILTSVRIPGAGLGMAGQQFFTFRASESGYSEETLHRGLHPMMAKRLHLWRFANFDLQRVPTGEDIYLFHGRAQDNPRDERLFAVAEVRDLTPVHDKDGRVISLPWLERMLFEAVAGIRLFQSGRATRRRLLWNRIFLYVWKPMRLSADEIEQIIQKLMSAAASAGLEKVVIRGRIPNGAGGELRDTVINVTNPVARGPMIEYRDPLDEPMRPLSPYRQRVVKMRQRGLIYPYEIMRLLTRGKEGAWSEFPPGHFSEYDLSDNAQLGPVDRSPGQNTANVVVGVIENYTNRQPEGMRRVVILSDPSRGMGALAEPECSRIVAALDLAEQLQIPVDWFSVSAGAKISMDSGTENLDWTSRVLRRLIEYTQAGGVVNLIVHGVNVGAQSYWNAEATMMMHTRGILIMTNDGAMVLTGKQALDYSGGVSAEDNFGIGGYGRIMGPNGQAQYWAPTLDEACKILLRYYEHSYVVPGERFPRGAPSDDPSGRDITDFPYDGEEIKTIGELFSDEKNPGRKRPFRIRAVMKAVADQDYLPLERWSAMRDAKTVVVWDAHLGGQPVCLIGLESQPLVRAGYTPADGPEQWTAGTLFPQSSRKVARAINSASGNRPVVVLANLSGFDGSPESMRQWQLEYGAEIGRAIVNFDGPIVFCVISRYHGGAFVVFSKALNENLEVAALEGAYASVIGGAPAAAVVFAREVRAMTESDPRVRQLEHDLSSAEGADRARLRAELNETRKAVMAEKRGEVAAEFDRIHSVQRARDVGSIDRIIPTGQLRPYLIDAVQRGIGRALERFGKS